MEWIVFKLVCPLCGSISEDFQAKKKLAYDRGILSSVMKSDVFVSNTKYEFCYKLYPKILVLDKIDK